MKRIFCERNPQRRATRSATAEVASVFPLPRVPAGNDDAVDDLLADIDALLDQCADCRD